MADFRINDHGSICTMLPLTDLGREWCDDRLPDDAPMHGNAYGIEPRYLPDIIFGLTDDGLTYRQ